MILGLITCLLVTLTTRDAMAATAEIPIDIGVGPAAHVITGPVQEDQLIHTGLVISIDAVIDKALIKKYKNRIPEKYRNLALSVDEARVSPSILIPDTLFISPGINNTGVYGVSWRPVSIGLPLLGKPGTIQVGLNAGARLTYLFIHSTQLDSPTHFLRPGLNLGADVEIPMSKKVLISLGWNSHAYIPQKIGGGVASLGTPDNWMWHIGQGYLKVHYRFPYTVSF